MGLTLGESRLLMHENGSVIELTTKKFNSINLIVHENDDDDEKEEEKEEERYAEVKEEIINYIQVNDEVSNDDKINEEFFKKEKKFLCVICISNYIEYAYIPCGHFCICKDCQDKYKATKKCPLCSQDITGSIKINF